MANRPWTVPGASAPRPLQPIVLAAGGGKRLGAPKALLTTNGRTFLATVLDALRLEFLRTPLVVVGAHSADVLRAVEDAHVAWVHNVAWETTHMKESLQCGLAACSPGDDVLVWPVDCPFDARDVITALRGALQKTPEAFAAVPTFGGQPGHPVLLAARAANAVRAGHEGSLRELLAHHADSTLLVAGTERRILRNVNDEASLRETQADP